MIKLLPRLFLSFLVLLSIPAIGQVANFSVSDTVGCSPMIINFFNSSTGATAYSWDFGDATNSSIPNPSHSYTAPGTYTIKLTAYKGTSTSIKTKTVVIYSNPVVDFTANVFSGCPGMTVNFTDNSNPVVPGAATYNWVFGDGFSSTQKNPAHVFLQPGDHTITLSVKNSGGCTNSLFKTAYIHVHTPPVADFTVSNTCKAPVNAQFTTNVTGTAPYSYSWNFGDGGTAVGNNPAHYYSAMGTYNVTLIVQDGNGCKDTLIKPITVGAMDASFTAPGQVCRNAPIPFNNTSVGGTFFTWDFGDGGSSTNSYPTYAYTAAGTYNVRLIANDIFNSCADTFFKSIQISPGPAASFNFSPLWPCPSPVSVSFNNTSTGAVSYHWDFDDGSTSTLANPTHQFNKDTTFRVILSATDAIGCVDSDTVFCVILPMNMGLHVVPLDTYSRCVPSTLTFSHGVIYPHPVTSVLWDFGDGSPTSSLASPSHTYSTPGTFKVQVAVTTANGCTKTAIRNFSFGQPPSVTYSLLDDTLCAPGGFIFYPQSATADSFSWMVLDSLGNPLPIFPSSSPARTTYPPVFPLYGAPSYGPLPRYYYPSWSRLILTPYNQGCAGLPYEDTIHVQQSYPVPRAKIDCDTPLLVRFRDSTLDAVDVRIWDFGDGSPVDTAKNPVHIYPAFGNYTPKLTIINHATGCTTQQTLTLKLYVPTANFWASDTTICKKDTIDLSHIFSDKSTTVNYSILPPVTSSTQLIKYFTGLTRFTSSVGGVFSIRLSWIDVNGCYHDTVKTNYITVGDPAPNFTAVPPIGCAPFITKFTEAGTNTPGALTAQWVWNFGDASTAVTNVDNVNHSYGTPGLYTVKVVVTDMIGCKDSVTRVNYIQAKRTQARYVANDTTACIGQIITFNNSSVSATASPLTFQWDFGDGNTSTARNPTHSYNAAGSYAVRLIARDNSGCSDTLFYNNYVKVGEATASFSMSDTLALCPPLNVQFTNTSINAATYLWDFGNGSSSVLANPFNAYVTPGIYTIRLIAYHSYGCPDTSYGTVKVLGYAGALSYAPVKGCNPHAVNFSVNLSNVSNFLWDYSDGTVATASGPTSTHVYTTPGKYLPKIIFFDNAGCVNSSDGLDTVYVDDVAADFVTSALCINTPIVLNDTSFSYFSPKTRWTWFIGGQVIINQSATVSFPAPGNYPVTLVVKNANGCQDTVTKNIDVAGLPAVLANGDTIICLNDAARLSASGAVNYAWSPVSTLSCVNCQTTYASPVLPTVYTVTGTDANGCKNRDSVKVDIKTRTTSEAGPDKEVCKESSVRLFATGATRYEWSPAATLDDPFTATPVATPLETTYYTVLAWEGSCIPDTNRVIVTVHPLPTVNAGTDETIVAGATVQLHAAGSLIETYRWSPVKDLNCETCSSPVASPEATTSYTVTVTSAFGCIAKDDVTVHILCDESQLFIPNTFSPNADGENDVFYPRGRGLSSILSFRVYNRWGEMVFEKRNIALNDQAAAWDGSYKGVILAPDVFVYVMEGICTSGERMMWKGDINLVR
jgi:gliding motility-associated-like protein